ncbi:MAG: electron transfer flavoprotein subunit alpha/FixB family protein, partial [Myxococcales bacterium]|nr:electron transfer flavoprotein subunit alpha/FixB family protein [Myxococcales bacterium]
MANGIWVIAEQRDGKLKKASFEGLKAAKQIKAALGQPITAVVLGSGVEGLAAELGQHGAEAVLVVDGAGLKDYNTDGYVGAVTALIKERQPEVVIGSATPIGLDLFPRVAARVGTGVLQDSIAIRVDGGRVVATRPVYSGKALAEVTIPDASPQMVTIRLNAVGTDAPDAGASASVEKVAPAAGDAKVKLTEIKMGETKKVDLTEADKIVSGGRAMKEAANFKILWDLAAAIGDDCAVGASRAAVDSGYAPHDMQVGQ